MEVDILTTYGAAFDKDFIVSFFSAVCKHLYKHLHKHFSTFVIIDTDQSSL